MKTTCFLKEGAAIITVKQENGRKAASLQRGSGKIQHACQWGRKEKK